MFNYQQTPEFNRVWKALQQGDFAPLDDLQNEMFPDHADPTLLPEGAPEWAIQSAFLTIRRRSELLKANDWSSIGRCWCALQAIFEYKNRRSGSA